MSSTSWKANVAENVKLSKQDSVRITNYLNQFTKKDGRCALPWVADPTQYSYLALILSVITPEGDTKSVYARWQGAQYPKFSDFNKAYSKSETGEALVFFNPKSNVSVTAQKERILKTFHDTNWYQQVADSDWSGEAIAISLAEWCDSLKEENVYRTTFQDKGTVNEKFTFYNPDTYTYKSSVVIRPSGSKDNEEGEGEEDSYSFSHNWGYTYLVSKSDGTTTSLKDLGFGETANSVTEEAARSVDSDRSIGAYSAKTEVLDGQENVAEGSAKFDIISATTFWNERCNVNENRAFIYGLAHKLLWKGREVKQNTTYRSQSITFKSKDGQGKIQITVSDGTKEVGALELTIPRFVALYCRVIVARLVDEFPLKEASVCPPITASIGWGLVIKNYKKVANTFLAEIKDIIDNDYNEDFHKLPFTTSEKLDIVIKGWKEENNEANVEEGEATDFQRRFLAALIAVGVSPGIPAFPWAGNLEFAALWVCAAIGADIRARLKKRVTVTVQAAAAVKTTFVTDLIRRFSQYGVSFKDPFRQVCLTATYTAVRENLVSGISLGADLQDDVKRMAQADLEQVFRAQTGSSDTGAAGF